MDQDIYAIYVLSTPWHLDKHGFPFCGGTEFVGFYYEEEVAIKAVKENWCNIQDHYAQAAEIRKFHPGLYPCVGSAYKYFIWDQEKKCFEENEFPKFEGWEL